MTPYMKGLEKLGLFKSECNECVYCKGPHRLHPGFVHFCQEHSKAVPHKNEIADLRTDPAFAWRVLEALYRFDYGAFLERWATKLCGDLVDEPLADALYAIVCELGKEK